MIFVGNLNNPTNLHGMVWFMREVDPASALPSPAQPTTTTQPHYHPLPTLPQVWPLVRAVEPRMSLRVVGSLEGESARASGLVEMLRSSIPKPKPYP